VDTPHTAGLPPKSARLERYPGPVPQQRSRSEIKPFADKNTKEFWDTGKSQGMPPANLRNVAWRTCESLTATDRKSCTATERATTAFESTINSASVSSGGTATPTIWR